MPSEITPYIEDFMKELAAINKTVITTRYYLVRGSGGEMQGVYISGVGTFSEHEFSELVSAEASRNRGIIDNQLSSDCDLTSVIESLIKSNALLIMFDCISADIEELKKITKTNRKRTQIGKRLEFKSTGMHILEKWEPRSGIKHMGFDRFPPLKRI